MHGASPAETDGDDQQQTGEINVAKWIQREPSLLPRCGVSKGDRQTRVGVLVERKPEKDARQEEKQLCKAQTK